MSMKVRAKYLKCNFKNGDFCIINWSPIGDFGNLKLSSYFTFSSKGEDSYLVEGKEYELEVEEISCDPRFGSCVRIISVPSMTDIDIKNLTEQESFEILMDCTSSEKIAHNILNAYPNFIEKILTEGQDSIDLSLWRSYGNINVQKVRNNSIDLNKKRLSKYICKLSNHAIKETTKRSCLIYSR